MSGRWIWIAAGVLALLAAAAGFFLWRSGTPVDEVAELAAEGDLKWLREPARAARGGERVLVFALDGVGDGALLTAVREGRAPRIAALLGMEADDERTFAHGYAVPGVLSILPSTTMAAWTSLFTGEPPARTGVPGNEWFERETATFRAPAPVSVTEHAGTIEMYTDDLLGRAIRVPTVYERAGVRSYVTLSGVYRGADLLVMPDLDAVGSLVAAVAEGVVEDETVSQEAYEELDRAGVEETVEALRGHGVPDLLTVYFPGVDLYSHVAEQSVEDQHRYVGEVLDAAVGDVLDAYAEAGALDGTWVLFVADHGHTPVLADDRHALGVDGGGEPTDVLRAAGFRVRAPHIEVEDDERDFQAVVAYQGAIAYVHLADRSTCPEPGDVCDWNRAPRLEEDVLPVARAFREASDTGALVPELRGTLDLVFAREPRPVGEDALPFRVWDGDGLVPVGDWLAANPRPDLLDLERRLDGLAAGPFGHRAGDVMLLARSGDGRPIEDRFYFSGEYRSWHGSPSPQDSRIPLVVARPGSDGAEVRSRVRALTPATPSQLDVAGLIEGLLGGGR